MDPERDKSGTTYDWQAWPPDSLEGMPPKRRRLVVWGLWWFLLLGTLLGIALDAANIMEPWRTLLATAGLAAVFGPLIRGAMGETRKLRAEGIDPPPYSGTPKSLISAAVVTAVLWAGFVVLVLMGRPVVPVLPIVTTVWLVYQRRRLRARMQEMGAGQE